MHSPAQTWINPPARAPGHIRSLFRVITWELRCCQASRLFWIQVSVLSAGLLFPTWVLRASAFYGNDSVAETSSAGLLLLLPLLLPFLTTDGVTRDQQRRTRVLMVTALPTWTYIWGRYLAVLLISLGLALLLPISFLAMGVLLHLTTTAYPLPQMGVLPLLWVGIVVPAVILVNSSGFALSTLLPRFSLLIKTAMSGIWIAGALLLPRVVDDPTLLPTWYVSWDPTSEALAHGPLSLLPFSPGSLHMTRGLMQHLLLVLERQSQTPDLVGWFVPHLLLGGLSLSQVITTALVFQRPHSATRAYHDTAWVDRCTR